ncbi:ATPase domain-containing protein [Ramlibacter sp. AN1015]|uniref:RAD55 family ATPase n=1 Tax=Ramlibacter sp. AN1015 TaxID=3133428 RepID=UPI0030C17C8F
MNHTTASPQAALPRIATGVPGLDEVTGGGFLQSGVYILQGAPGAGKTILSNQIAYHHAAGGGNVVYVTLLAESHARLLQHMQSFSFFDPSAAPERIYYISAFNALRSEGLPGVVKLLQAEMRARGAGLLVLDGLVMAAEAAASDESLKLFVSDLQAHSSLSGCTTLLLTSAPADRGVTAEQTMVDGILLLRERAFGPRRERNIEVVKFRGSRTLRGNHSFQIGPTGIVIFPRLESMPRGSADFAATPVGVSLGVPGLDRMFDIGGIAQGSVATIAGASGSGKTTLALHFLAQSAAHERGIFLGFYETPKFLQAIARRLGIDPAGVLCGPNVEFLWQPLGENLLDEVAQRLLERVEQSGARRVVVDGLGGFLSAPAFAERGESFLAAFANELRRLGATTLMTIEDVDPSRAIQAAAMSAVADTILRLRVTEHEAVRRFVWLGKSRMLRSDLRVRELALGAEGLSVRQEPDVVA